jgi:hypothetical protein
VLGFSRLELGVGRASLDPVWAIGVGNTGMVETVEEHGPVRAGQISDGRRWLGRAVDAARAGAVVQTSGQ